MGNIIVNGRRISVSGNSISVINDQVFVDGRRIDVESEVGPAAVYNIVVQGSVGQVSGDFANIEVTENAGSVSTMSGRVEVGGDVQGSVSTMSGRVEVDGSVKGNVSTISGRISK